MVSGDGPRVCVKRQKKGNYIILGNRTGFTTTTRDDIKARKREREQLKRWRRI